MKKKSSSDLARLQASADKQGVRLQQANASRDMTDAGVVAKRLKKGPYKDHEPVM